MKINKREFFYCVMLAGFALAQTASAQLVGTEDFSGGTVDTSKWGSDITSGVGTLTQTGGVLLYTTSGTPTSKDQAIHPWNANFGSYTQNWSVQLDVNMQLQTLTSGQELSIGLAAVNANNTDDDLVVALQQDVPHGTLFFSNYDINGASQTPVELGGLTPGLAAVQIVYNASTHFITTSYDADGPGDGYFWTALDSRDVSAWGMTNSDQFLIAITGSSQPNLSVPSGSQVWADNFQAQTIPEPAAWPLLGGLAVGFIALARRRKSHV